ncbi:MAG: formate--tetrahydrofolate ligase [Pseudomonadota bacterium]
MTEWGRIDDPRLASCQPTAPEGLLDDGLPPPGSPDITIARAATMRPILPLAEDKLGIPAEALVPYGHFKAKLDHGFVAGLAGRPQGKLVLVTAMTPTPAGEGKTTTSVGLSDGLNHLGVRATVCLREPSLGPCFGMKGGAAGGGRAQVLPMEDINLHFTGDFHAVTSAHNLVSAVLDNHLHWGNELDVDLRRVSWKRVIDMNDRALRHLVTGLGGPAHGLPREDGFDITVASEVMAILCLADGLDDLQGRLRAMVVARRHDKTPVTAGDLGVDGAMAVLLRDALQPNLVQTIAHNPAFIHGGPFANIAHGCNSVTATKAALALNDVIVTEAGFGADLGAEKFIDIKCRQSGLRPDAVVLVCTVRALKMQGGVVKRALGTPDPAAVGRGTQNLARHIANLRQFGLSPVVAINGFTGDSADELDMVFGLCREFGVDAVLANHWAAGPSGATDLATAVLNALERRPPDVVPLYPDTMALADKIRTVAQRLYGAADIHVSEAAGRAFEDFEALGFGELPVCIAKTQYSFSADPTVLGAPEGHVLPVREARLAAGAGFVIAICGDIMTMPGLPRRPSALDVGLDDAGNIVGLS